ncbi:MAG TPA: pyridoxamine 5'-phosphate oxidase family protein [Anaerolineae bacterium]|nr:pyridoxamine 5'-phosphate oxidase family protein [Anaerolineae bacterium]
MTILESSPGLLEALHGAMTPKFAATRSAEGTPNVVPLVSITPAEDQVDTLFFGNFLLRKTIANLDQDPRVAILVITPELRGWVLTADFVEWQRTGSYVDAQNSSALLRYNAYTGIRNAGILRVRSVEGSFAISKLQVARDFVLTRLAAFGARGGDGGVVLPLAVRREFARMVAVKVLAWGGEDGYPVTAPALSLSPLGSSSLIAWRGPVSPPDGATVAANILTFAAISYQVKGKWRQQARTGTLTVQEAYAGGPPLPGGRVA